MFSILQRKINTSSEHWECTCLPKAVMGHRVENEEDSGIRGMLRGVRTLMEDSQRVHLAPNRARDCKEEYGLKCKVALNKVHDPF